MRLYGKRSKRDSVTRARGTRIASERPRKRRVNAFLAWRWRKGVVGTHPRDDCLLVLISENRFLRKKVERSSNPRQTRGLPHLSRERDTGKTLAAVGARRSRTPVLVWFPIATHARAPRRRALHPPLPTMSAWGASGAWASQVRSRSGSRPPPSPTAPDATKPCARRLPASGGGAQPRA